MAVRRLTEAFRGLFGPDEVSDNIVPTIGDGSKHSESQAPKELETIVSELNTKFDVYAQLMDKALNILIEIGAESRNIKLAKEGKSWNKRISHENIGKFFDWFYKVNFVWDPSVMSLKAGDERLHIVEEARMMAEEIGDLLSSYINYQWTYQYYPE